MRRRSSRTATTPSESRATVELLERRALLAAADLDTTLRIDGIAITPHGGLSEQDSSVALAPDGKVVLAGTANGTTTGQDFVVTRLHADGRTDTSFNRGSAVQTDYSSEHNRVDGVTVQPDG